MSKQVTISRYTNTKNMEWRAKLSDGNTGVSHYGSTPEIALANLAKHKDITGIDVVTDNTELKKVTIATRGEGRFKTSEYKSI